MTKIAIIVGGVVLMAGVALAGTLTSIGSSSTPAGQTISPPAATTNGVLDDRGQENELRGRQNEAGEDQRGQENEVRGRANEAGDDNGNDVGDDHSNRGSGGGEDNSGHGGHGGDDD